MLAPPIVACRQMSTASSLPSGAMRHWLAAQPPNYPHVILYAPPVDLTGVFSFSCPVPTLFCFRNRLHIFLMHPVALVTIPFGEHIRVLPLRTAQLGPSFFCTATPPLQATHHDAATI